MPVVNGASFNRLLEVGITELGLSVTASQRERLLHYLELLVRWNRTYNLIGAASMEQIIARHLLDSLSIVPHLRGRRFADVGSGAGLPGIPLAIALPDSDFTLVDSNGKKIRFLCHIRSALKLANVAELQTRVEHYVPDQAFDGVISRAFSSLATFTTNSQHLLAEGGCLFAMKGHCGAEELSEIPKPYTVAASHRLHVPGLESQRQLIVLNRA